MVNLTDSGGFTRPLWNSGPDSVVVFDRVEDAIEAADRYLRVESSASHYAQRRYSWERFPQTGPMAFACAFSAMGRFSLSTEWGEKSWLAVVFKLERSSKSPMLTETAFEALRMCIGRANGKPEYVAQAIALVNALEEESKKGS